MIQGFCIGKVFFTKADGRSVSAGTNAKGESCCGGAGAAGDFAGPHVLIGFGRETVVLQPKHGEVVELEGVLRIIVHGFPDMEEQLVRSRIRLLVQRIQKPVGPEHLPRGVVGHGHTVGIDKETVVGLQLKGAVCVPHRFGNTEAHIVPVDDRLERTSRLPEYGVLMTRIAGKALASGQLKHRRPDRHRHLGLVAVTELEIDAAQRFRRESPVISRFLIRVFDTIMKSEAGMPLPETSAITMAR